MTGAPKATPLKGERTGALPREIDDGLLWFGGCIVVDYRGRQVHSHMSAYLVKGSEKTLLVDTGYPGNAKAVSRDVLGYLDGRPLDYIFVTHVELPHSGMLSHWAELFPQARIVGRTRDFHLHFPHLGDRMTEMHPGSSVSLGDRAVLFLPAVWRDLRDTMWAFDTGSRTLFVSDGFSYLHHHQPGECDFSTSEGGPTTENMQFFNERALPWTQHGEVAETFGEIDALVDALQPVFVASAHGGVTDDPGRMIPLFKQGMLVGRSGT